MTEGERADEEGLAGLILDFGGVLWDMRWDVARDLERRHGLPPRALLEALYRTPAWEEIQRGRGEPGPWRADAHRRLERLAGGPLPPVHEMWLASQAPVAASIGTVRRLRRRYRLALLSNADCTLRSRLGALGLLDAFDTVVASAEEGLAKPEPAIYRLAAARLGLPPAACLFVDDHEPNVAAAIREGMQGLHLLLHRGETLASRLEQVGVTVDAD